MLYEFKCKCGHVTEEFMSYKQYEIPMCVVCDQKMERVFTPFAFHEHKRKIKEGVVELGNEYPEPTKVDHMKGVENKIHEVLESGVDLDGSNDFELNRLSA